MLQRRLSVAAPRRRGAALLLSVLVLIVVITIVIQISISTITDARVARNSVGITTMEQAIESVLLQVYEDLLADMDTGGGEAGMPDGMPGGAGMPGGGMPDVGGGGGGAGGEGESPPPAVDSRMDEWAIPARTELNGIEMRILIQDEDSKYNVLNLVHPDDERADQARERVARIIDLARDGTQWDLSYSEGEEIARAMQDHMRQRTRARIPKPEQLSDNPEERDLGLPLTLAEFASLEDLHPGLFREFRDENDNVVHSLHAFLTVHTSMRFGPLNIEAGGAAPENPEDPENPGETPPEQTPPPETPGGGETPAGGEPDFSGGGANGWGVNVNTAPPAVLYGLVDDRDVPRRFWDEVIEYRNLEKEKEPAARGSDEETGLQLVDEFGDELMERQIFESLQDLTKVRGWEDLQPEEQQKVLELLTTQSQVFSIYITARRSTAAQAGFGMLSPEDRRIEEESGIHLTRTVRSIVWRSEGTTGNKISPIVRWEVVDYVPYEIVDDPRERFRR